MNAKQQRLAELLIECQGRGAVSANGRAELNDLLRESEELREFAAGFMLDGKSLTELLATNEIAGITSRRSKSDSVSPLPRGNGRRWLGLAATVAFGLLAGVAFWLSREEAGPIAEVVDEAEAEWAIGAGSSAGILSSGTHELEAGLATVVFRNGVQMTVRAPSRFEIIDEFRVILHHGEARASAPESGHGFTIETPTADLVDLGTEFGVSVDESSGESHVYVFDGRVDVKRKEGRVELASLEFGQAARIVEGQIEKIRPPVEGTFPSPDELGHARWLALDADLQKDEDLVLYYNFSPREGDREQLFDVAENGSPIHGRIKGARWVSGRWPGKAALLFDQPGDAVELKIQQELTQFTFSAWVKADRWESSLTPFLNSHDWMPGGLHFQYSRSAAVLFGAVHHGIDRGESIRELPLGKWVHILVTVDTVERRSRSWIDGRLAAESTLHASIGTCLPGFCRLGYWETDSTSHAPRSFRGRMDEVAIWDRVLSEREIRRLAKLGRP